MENTNEIINQSIIAAERESVARKMTDREIRSIMISSTLKNPQLEINEKLDIVTSLTSDTELIWKLLIQSLMNYQISQFDFHKLNKGIVTIKAHT